MKLNIVAALQAEGDKPVIPVINHNNGISARVNLRSRSLKMFVDSLPEKCREIFILACIEGLKYKQVAEKLDVSVNTVKTQLKSAYSKLRAEFNENDLEIIVLLIFLGYM